jgi:putative membrane-bound dehydrogenase-like protein
MRMEPDGTNLEVIGFNFRNSYEQTVTSFGDVFQNDNDDPPACRTTFLMEYGNAGWFSRDGTRYWRADQRPGQSIQTAQWRQEDPGVIPSGDVYGAGAPTGIVYYEGDALGKDWRGLLLSCESARNTVFGYKPVASGAGFELERFHFLTSNQEEDLAGTDALGGKTSEELKTFFRPSDVSVGPDGAIYVADWFDALTGGPAVRPGETGGRARRRSGAGLGRGRPGPGPWAARRSLRCRVPARCSSRPTALPAARPPPGAARGRAGAGLGGDRPRRGGCGRGVS